MKKVSVYIPCFNSEKTIKKCIESVINQTYPVGEIIIIDDGSTDNTLKLISEYNVRLIKHKKNEGLAKARNTGVLYSRNEFIAALDSDCYASPTWLEYLIKSLNKKTLCGAGGKLIEAKTKCLVNKWRAQHMPQNWGDKKLLNPLFLYGSNSLFKRSLIQKIGMYNPKFKKNYEDVDLSNRIKKKYGLIYQPKAVVYHLKKDSTFSVLRNYWNWNLHSTKIPQSILELKKQLGHNIAKTKFCIKQDGISKEYKLLIIDFILLPVLCIFDIINYLKNETS